MDELYGQFSSGDPDLVAALASREPAAVAAVHRFLRLTPLSTLIRNRASLVRLLVAVPELHERLRATWTRQDAVLTARVFSWTEQSRLASARSDGRGHHVPSWMQQGELPHAS